MGCRNSIWTASILAFFIICGETVYSSLTEPRVTPEQLGLISQFVLSIIFFSHLFIELPKKYLFDCGYHLLTSFTRTIIMPVWITKSPFLKRFLIARLLLDFKSDESEAMRKVNLIFRLNAFAFTNCASKHELP